MQIQQIPQQKYTFIFYFRNTAAVVLKVLGFDLEKLQKFGKITLPRAKLNLRKCIFKTFLKKIWNNETKLQKMLKELTLLRECMFL